MTRDRRTLWLFAGLAVFVVGAFAFAVIRFERRQAPPVLAVRATDPSLGSAGAAVQVISFADFQCQFCKEQEEVFRRLREAFPSDLRIVWKDLPLLDLHPQALPAAVAARCAQGQGKFWEYHDALYAEQETLGVERYREIARTLSLDLDAFAACYNTQEPLPLVTQGQREAAGLGIASTPSFFINGRPFDELTSFDELSAHVQALLGR